MADTWYLIIRTPTPTTDVWPIGPNPEPDDEPGIAVRDAYIDAGKTLMSVPAWWWEMAGWDVAYAPGTPHPSVLAVATVHNSPPSV